MSDKEKLIEIKHLSKHFPVETNFFGKTTSVLKAVDDLSLDIYKGEALGLVGESGCGKSTIGKLIVNLHQPTAGEIIYQGKNLTAMSENERRGYCKDIQLIFQDPYASLNPRMTIGDIIAEPIRTNKLLPNDQIEDRVNYLLNCVGLANHHRNRYPHEFSGGQRQRIGIARALIVEPEFIVADEPISALDMSIRAQVLNLLRRLQKERDITYLFIAHDLSVMRYISDRIAVIHKGSIVELADAEELVAHAIHPYTRSLLSAIPMPDPRRERNKKLLVYDPAMHDYSTEAPQWRELRPRHWVLCSAAEAAQWLPQA